MSQTQTAVTDSKFGFSFTAPYRAAELNAFEGLCDAFEQSPLPLARKLQNFPRHVRRQDLARMLVRAELFKEILHVNGSIIECGVFCGGGLLTWLHLSAIYEPYNHTRRIVGLDTFSGFPGAHEKDASGSASAQVQTGQLSTHADMQAELEKLVALHDQNRPLGHISKVSLVAGDALQTIPQFVGEHPHLLVSLLYLDFDLYEPTKAALKHLLPRVVSGGIVAFDELNCPEFPGETQAFLETPELKGARLQRSPIDPYISYCVLP